MNPEDDVIDRIDALVDESLSKSWDQISGYDNDINQPVCRCGRAWHGLPDGGCPGSPVEGPLAAPREFTFTVDVGPDPFVVLRRQMDRFAAAMGDMGLVVERAAGLWQQVAGTWTLPDDPFDLDTWTDTSEPQTPQQRALPRPSTTPPMWANQPNRNRRTRNR